MSSVITPLGPRHGDGSAVGYELLHAQVTRAQGIFSPRAVHAQYGIDYIAANLDTPTVTLHYPSEKDFVKELQTGGYTHVGIPFTLSTSHVMRHMSTLVRKHAPEATLILAGYGTILPDAELLRHGDVICRGEGVAFMRNLLGEPPLRPPYAHPLSISTLRVLGLPTSKTGLVFGGLGCPNGCDFCCTSHFFKRRHIPLLPTGRDVFEVLKAYREVDPEMQFTVLDEDFLLNKRRAMELRELLLASHMTADLFVFASVKALSMYTPQELVEIGVGGVWIGYEGRRAGYAKQVGRPIDELFADLKRHGILILASMIIGLPYHTTEIVKEELEALMALQPTLAQFLIYGPTPGTPLGDRTDAEDGWLPEYRDDDELRWRRSDGFSSMTRHPNMTAAEIEGLQKYCFEEDFKRLGPSILRSVDVWQQGLAYLRDRPEPSLARRAEWLARRAVQGKPIVPLAMAMAMGSAGSHQQRAWLADLSRRLGKEETFGQRWTNRLLGTLAFPAAAVAAAGMAFDIGQDPKLTRNDWSTDAHPAIALTRHLADEGAVAPTKLAG
jgi:hypothetical protein